MRLIDADAMLEYLDLMYDKQDDWREPYNVGVLGAINYIKHKAPTIDAVSVEWIPCGERLPKRQGYYICTCKDGSKYKRTTVVKWSNGWQLTGARAYWVVLAWMTLPKPYERSDT